MAGPGAQCRVWHRLVPDAVVLIYRILRFAITKAPSDISG